MVNPWIGAGATVCFLFFINCRIVKLLNFSWAIAVFFTLWKNKSNISFVPQGKEKITQMGD